MWAFKVASPEDRNAAVPPDVSVTLYGVSVVDARILSGLDPFSVTATAVGDATVLVIRLTAAPPDSRLTVRSGQRTNEIEVWLSAGSGG